MPGLKTYILAAVATAVFWGANAGIVPPEVAEPVQTWTVALMAGTVGHKVYRTLTGKDA